MPTRSPTGREVRTLDTRASLEPHPYAVRPRPALRSPRRRAGTRAHGIPMVGSQPPGRAQAADRNSTNVIRCATVAARIRATHRSRRMTCSQVNRRTTHPSATSSSYRWQSRSKPSRSPWNSKPSASITMRSRSSARSTVARNLPSRSIRAWGVTLSPGICRQIARSTDSIGPELRPSAWRATRATRCRPRAGQSIARSASWAGVIRRLRRAESAMVSASSNGRVAAQSATVRNGVVTQPATSADGSDRCESCRPSPLAPTLRPRGTVILGRLGSHSSRAHSSVLPSGRRRLPRRAQRRRERGSRRGRHAGRGRCGGGDRQRQASPGWPGRRRSEAHPRKRPTHAR